MFNVMKQNKLICILMNPVVALLSLSHLHPYMASNEKIHPMLMLTLSISL